MLARMVSILALLGAVSFAGSVFADNDSPRMLKVCKMSYGTQSYYIEAVIFKLDGTTANDIVVVGGLTKDEALKVLDSQSCR